ncbi:MAG: hypothetical protein QXL69_00985 [Candidatus Bathyarchaeia archaeon]
MSVIEKHAKWHKKQLKTPKGRRKISEKIKAIKKAFKDYAEKGW